jgi:hypothetical protein
LQLRLSRNTLANVLHSTHQTPSHACDCAAHRKAVSSGSGLWASLLPALVCAVCPACLTAYAKILSTLGIGFGLNEAQHLGLLAATVALSVSLSAWRSWQTRRPWPVAIALVGACLLLSGHFAGDLQALEWTGAAVLLAGGLVEQSRTRRGTLVVRA